MHEEQKDFNSYLNTLSGSLKDNIVDKSVEEKMAVLEDIFGSNENVEDDSFSLETNLPFQNTSSFSKIENDSNKENNSDLNKTKEIDSVDLEELRKLKEQLNALSKMEESQNQGQSKGRQKVLTSNSKIKYSDDVSQIVNSFMSCFVLAFVTAAIGTGWLINLIIHLK